MKKEYIILILIVLFSSCVKEYDNFYPYKNHSLEFIYKLKSKTRIYKVSNNEHFEYSSGNGVIVEIPANSFSVNLDSFIFEINVKSTLTDMIANRISTTSNDKLFSIGTYIYFNIYDLNHEKIEFTSNKEIIFKIPHSGNLNTKLLRYNNEKWKISNPEKTSFMEQTWFRSPKDSTLIHGYRIGTKINGIFCLADYIDLSKNINNIEIKLSDNFDVNNSIVQANIKDTHCNIELNWNKTKKVFVLPANIILPSNKINIVVLSEDSDQKIYFGMKYAEVNNGEVISIDMSRKRVEEIKMILDESFK